MNISPDNASNETGLEKSKRELGFLSHPEHESKGFPCVIGWGPSTLVRDDLLYAIERGAVGVVQDMLSDPEVTKSLTENNLVHELVFAQAWLLEAEAFESMNGPGSKLDPDHPFNRDVLPLLRTNTTLHRR